MEAIQLRGHCFDSKIYTGTKASLGTLVDVRFYFYKFHSVV